jgi:signal transduction histidine kinase
LGLSISHGIISEHGGWIDVSSKLGKGSVFSIYLPMEKDK